MSLVENADRQAQNKLPGSGKHVIHFLHGGVLKAGRWRLALVVAGVIAAFALIAGRLIIYANHVQPISHAARSASEKGALVRPRILDRKGRVLAMDIKMASLYADPAKVLDIDETAEKLGEILPKLNQAKLRRRLAGKGRFVWVRRKLAPRQKAQIEALGLTGLYFVDEPRRVYPAGSTAAHVLGTVDIDNRGLLGIEKYIDDDVLKDGGGGRGDITLSLDLAVQHVLRAQIAAAMKVFRAKAAAALLLDVNSGEVVAMSSLPDYDPNRRAGSLAAERFNRVTGGVFELGSVFKTLTVAMGLDSGKADLATRYDASKPIKIGGFTIQDFHGLKRPVSVAEIFTNSSNIGAAKMAVEAGSKRQRAFLARLGLLQKMRTQIGPVAVPLIPKPWRKIHTMTISYGHGLSVAPLQFAAATAPLFNGGFKITPTFLKTPRHKVAKGPAVIKARTSKRLRYLMRLNVKEGTGRRANVPGYRVGGKTGTADKPVNGKYGEAVLTSFLSIFPADKPEYLLYVMFDAPQSVAESEGRTTAGYNAVPATARIIERIGPILGIMPRLGKEAGFDEQAPAAY